LGRGYDFLETPLTLDRQLRKAGRILAKAWSEASASALPMFKMVRADMAGEADGILKRAQKELLNHKYHIYYNVYVEIPK